MEKQTKYLYRHLDAKTGRVFYMGVGTKKEDKTSYRKKYSRAHLKAPSLRTSLWYKQFTKANKNIEVQILKESTDENEIYELETLLIMFYGRIDMGTGTLANRTNGKFVKDAGRKFTKEHKEKISNYRKTIDIRGENNHYYGKKHTEEIRSKMRGKRPNSCGENHFRANIVLNTLNGIFYESIREVSDHYNFPYSTLRKWLNPKNENKSYFIIA